MTAGASRVQQELDELREKHLTSHQRDKYKDFTSPLTTPEEAQAFLATMRDKQKAADVSKKPPANLTADGMDAWFYQQREREREMRLRRQEAEALLRGYRMTMSHDKSVVATKTKETPYGLSPLRGRLFDDGMSTISESMDSLDYDGVRRKHGEVGRLSIDESTYSSQFSTNLAKDVGRLSLDGSNNPSKDSMEESTNTAGSRRRHSIGGSNSSVHSSDGSTTSSRRKSCDAPGTRGLDQSITFGKNESDYMPATPQNQEEEKKTDGLDYGEKQAPQSSRKSKCVPTPAKPMMPDETEWRDFVSSEPGATFPPEVDRYHLYASYACPGSHRALIIRALKGLENVVSVTIVHPTWRLTRGFDPDEKDQRGWVFGDPDGEPFANTAGRGGPFPAAFPNNEPDPIFNAFSIREIYENAGDNAGKYTVPLLWDKKLKTIVNNESSDISYMFNSRFNEFADNPDLDLYTEDDPVKLNETIEWLAPMMIHGVYRCGFAKTQSLYDKAISELTQTFDRADALLQKQRFLTGDTLTDADIRLFVTLLRFDEVYAFYFKANSRLVMLTPSLLNYCRDIYQMEGVAPTCNMEQIKVHFYSSHAEWNKFSIIPQGLGFMKLLEQPHNRDQFDEV